MDKLVELVAQARCCPDGCRAPEKNKRMPGLIEWRCEASLYNGDAEKILQALSDAGYAVVPREPTNKMIEAGHYCAGSNFRDAWQAMIKEFEGGAREGPAMRNWLNKWYGDSCPGWTWPVTFGGLTILFALLMKF